MLTYVLEPTEYATIGTVWRLQAKDFLLSITEYALCFHLVLKDLPFEITKSARSYV